MSHGLASDHCRKILQAMRAGGDRDWTAHELASACQLTSEQVCRRFAELRDAGEILETANTRPTPIGRPARCFRAGNISGGGS